MKEIDYCYFLSPEKEDRLRVFGKKHQNQILEFLVQYEAFIRKKWCPIVRYDTAHGFAHKDVIHPDGAVDKQPLYFPNYKLAFTFAIQDLRSSWKIYREDYERRIKNAKR